MFCLPCNFKTTRKDRFTRHIESAQHKTLAFLFSDDETGENNQSEQTEEEAELPSFDHPALDHELDDETLQHEQPHLQIENETERNENLPEPEESQPIPQGDSMPHRECDNWFPFESKVEMLLYVFMNSTSHPVSDEVVKYVTFMLRQLGVQEIPSLKTLKEKKFGCFCWEDMISKGNSKDNTPVWIVKPSSLLQLMIANPHISKSVIRKPENSDLVKHPSNAKKWREDMDFSETGSPVVHLPINLFLDDTATHKSKQWLALHCIQMQLAGLPLQDRKKLGGVKFVGASEKVDIMDVARDIVDDIRQLENTGVESFDAFMERSCVVKSSLDIIVADYNMMSYCCNHLGATAKKYCPRCHADSETFMSICRERTPRETQQVVDRLNLRSTEADKKQLRKLKGVKEHDNVFWDIFNPHRDIPVGLLHLIPLGLAKDLVIYICDQLSGERIEHMKCHLESIRPESQFADFFKHIRSKQGKHFKGYLQIAPFNMMYAGVQRKYVNMVTCLSMIQRKLNTISFSTMDIENLREDIRHYHQLVHQHLPDFKKKVKVHLLLHVIEDIIRHGPPRCYEEDQFESNHGTIRNLIFKQNQKARSRDTCVKFARSYLCTHAISGGFVQDGENWRQPSSKVVSLGKSGPIMTFLGLEETEQKKPGTISLLERNKNGNPITVAQDEDQILQALLHLNISNLEDYSLCRGAAVTTKSKELVHSGEWVKYLDPENNECYGMFKEGLIITPKRGQTKLITSIQKSMHTETTKVECPQLKLIRAIHMVPSVNILEKVEAVHDCGVGCALVDKARTERVEQEEILRQTVHLKHDFNNTMYLLNVFKVVGVP